MNDATLRTLKVRAPGCTEIDVIYTGVAVSRDMLESPQVYLTKASAAVRQVEAGPTIRKIIAAYFRHLRLRILTDNYSVRHLENWRHILRRFAEWAGKKTVRQCEKDDLRRWLAVNPTWKSNSAKRHAIRAVCECFKWAFDEEKIDPNPYARGRQLLKRMPAQQRQPAKPEHYTAVIRCAARPLRRILRFIWAVGTRTCEPRELTWDDIDLKTGHVRMLKHKTALSTGRPREFVLPDQILRLVRRLRLRNKGGSQVFLNGRGSPWTRTELCHQFRDAAARAKRRGLADDSIDLISAYSLRHSRITEAVKSGGSRQDLKHHFGCSEAMLDQHYDHSGTEVDHLREVAARFSRKRSKKPPRKPRDDTDQGKLFST